MKALVFGLAAAVLIAANVAAANAAHKRHLKRHVQHVPTYSGVPQRYPNEYGWYPHDPERLAFGSRIWWDEMEREGRLRGGRH
jgi:hypothetical protein